MKNVSVVLIVVAAIAAIIAGITRLADVEIMGVAHRVWAGVAAILLLFSIAINTLPKN
ncbi:MAG: hypothetical protein NZ870_04720 [bacterium]|nr:hypothetical protein [bacterium]